MKKKKRVLIIILLLLGTVACSEKPPVKVLFMGDLLLAKGAELKMIEQGSGYPFVKLDSELRKYNLVVANLENSITERGEEYKNKTFRFRLSPANAGYLINGPIGVYTLANNHLLDYGEKGCLDTLEYLALNKKPYCGAGKNLEEARKPVIMNVGGNELVFLAYCERPPEDFYATDKKMGTAPLIPEQIIEDIKKYKRKNNLVILSLHWGVEHENIIREDQRENARRFIDSGADLIIGHHPHVPQGYEIYKGKTIWYSLGNAICGYYNDRYMDNIFVGVNIRKNKIESVEILPVAGKNEVIEFQPYILNEIEGNRLLDYISANSIAGDIPLHKNSGRGEILLSPAAKQ